MRAIACDLDRTLIAEDVVLRPRTRAAIAAARSGDIHVVIVTGRMFRSVRHYALDAGIDAPVVCYQGAVVADPVSGEFLRHVPMPLAEAREVIEAVEGLGFTILCYVDDNLCVARRLKVSAYRLDHSIHNQNTRGLINIFERINGSRISCSCRSNYKKRIQFILSVKRNKFFKFFHIHFKTFIHRNVANDAFPQPHYTN